MAATVATGNNFAHAAACKTKYNRCAALRVTRPMRLSSMRCNMCAVRKSVSRAMHSRRRQRQRRRRVCVFVFAPRHSQHEPYIETGGCRLSYARTNAIHICYSHAEHTALASLAAASSACPPACLPAVHSDTTLCITNQTEERPLREPRVTSLVACVLFRLRFVLQVPRLPPSSSSSMIVVVVVVVVAGRRSFVRALCLCVDMHIISEMIISFHSANARGRKNVHVRIYVVCLFVHIALQL